MVRHHNEVRQCDTFLIEIYTGGDPGSWALGRHQDIVRVLTRWAAGGSAATRMLTRADNQPSGSFHSALLFVKKSKLITGTQIKESLLYELPDSFDLSSASQFHVYLLCLNDSLA